jgi:tRNA(fMet)-specific endonuclease VapC
MTHLLDTNICSAHMRRPAGLAHRFFQHAGTIAISTVDLAELYAGAYKHPNPPRLLGLIADLLQEVAVLDFDSLCAEQFGRIQGGVTGDPRVCLGVGDNLGKQKAAFLP